MMQGKRIELRKQNKGQIGKEAQVNLDSLVFDKSNSSRAFVDVSGAVKSDDEWGAEGKLGELKLVKRAYTNPVLLARRGVNRMDDVSDNHKELINSILSLLETSPPELFTFYEMIKDVSGFAAPGNNLIALHKEIAENPIALFHELSHYLTDSGQVQLKMNKQMNGIRVYYNNDEIAMLSISKTTRENFIKKEEVNWEQTDSRWFKNPHYLLRIMQQELFEGEDTELTEKIMEIKRRKRVVYSSEDGAKITYEIIGEGEVPLVFLHYWGGSREQWYTTVDKMRDNPEIRKKYKFVLMDLRGFG